MQLKKFYSKMSFLGIATVMALTACGDDNSDVQFATNPNVSQTTPGTENPKPGTDSIPDSGNTVTPPADSGTTLPPAPGELPAEGPITLPQGILLATSVSFLLLLSSV